MFDQELWARCISFPETSSGVILPAAGSRLLIGQHMPHQLYHSTYIHTPTDDLVNNLTPGISFIYRYSYTDAA